MKTIKIGIFGLRRGGHFYSSLLANNAEVVAICDANPNRIQDAKRFLGDDVAVYSDFDAFLNHDGLEAVFLCNFFHEHAPYAIRALERNIHVLSECTSNGTMAEGVALVRAAEKSKAIYMLAENYPFMKFNQEMRRVYQGGTLGKCLFAEGEYNHPLDMNDTKTVKDLRPYPKHWRNNLPRTYYITHSLAPLVHITGATPIRVTAMPVYFPDEREGLMGSSIGDRAAIITLLNDDNSVFRVTGCAAFGAHENSYRICGTKGQIENIRGSEKVLLRYNSWDVPENAEESSMYSTDWDEQDRAIIEKAGHGGGDFFVIREFLNCIRQNKKPDFDVYFATNLASVGILAHRSAMENGVPYDVPDFRKEADRIQYENDRLTPFWGSDGSAPTLSACSHADFKLSDEALAEYHAIVNNA